jgi:hypothetical protein
MVMGVVMPLLMLKGISKGLLARVGDRVFWDSKGGNSHAHVAESRARKETHTCQSLRLLEIGCWKSG